ncbi:hypothetical protein TNCV_1369901 [Trichonephila clavipes]|nr:hypothetical protein TNCV_1369901 [Trichonephila clavipes]
MTASMGGRRPGEPLRANPTPGIMPANSTNLNSTEHLFDLIERDINQGPLAHTVDDLSTAVDVSWQRLPLATINGLVDRMARRIETCVTARGGDEAHFWLNGYVNKQNCRIWSEANPQVYVETPLHPEKLTVWCALWAGGILLQKR